MSKNWPVHRISIIAITPLLVVFCLQLFYFQVPVSVSPQAMIWFWIGVIYVYIFEYIHHRGPMHTKIIIHFELMGSVNKIFEPINKVLNAIRMSHLWLHHRIFRGDNFQSDKKEDLEQITSPWPFFLIAFVLHYVFLVAVSFALHHLALVAVLPINSLNFFSIGVVVRYLLVYEILHFFTHKKNNKFDKFISCKFIKIPVLGPIVANLRAEQVEHHKKHHNDVKINFAVTPPYTLDNIGNTRAVT